MALRNEEEPPMAELVSGKASEGIDRASVQAALPEDAFIREMIEELSWPRDQIRANLVGYEVVVRCSPADVVKVCTQVEEMSMRHDLYIATHQDLELGGLSIPCKRVLYINRIASSGNPKTLKEAWMFFKSRFPLLVVQAYLDGPALYLETTMYRRQIVDLLNGDFAVKFVARFGSYVKSGQTMTVVYNNIMAITMRDHSTRKPASHSSGCCLC